MITAALLVITSDLLFCDLKKLEAAQLFGRTQVTLDLGELLGLEFHLSSVVEMSLSANLRKATAEAARLQWRVANESRAPEVARGGAARTRGAPANTVTLKPRQIKTFLLNAQPLDAPAGAGGGG